MATIRLIAGLGNPGAEHLLDRHNAGFWFADALAQAHGAAFRAERRFSGELCRIDTGGNELLLFKPTAYMNRSGLPLRSLCDYRKIPPAEVLVAHDELDLPPGTVRLKRGGGHGGHNGLRSLIQHLPDASFVRVRVGVGRPPPRWDPADYVLSRFTRDERPDADRVVTEAADAIEAILKDGLARVMNVYNRSPEKAGGDRGADRSAATGGGPDAKEEEDG